MLLHISALPRYKCWQLKGLLEAESNKTKNFGEDVCGSNLPIGQASKSKLDPIDNLDSAKLGYK